MEVGAAVWVLEDNFWREAAVISVDEQAGVVECSLEPETSMDQLVTDGDDSVHPVHGSEQDFMMAPQRKRRNSRLNRRGSVRRMLPVPIASVLPRNHGEAYHQIEDLTKLVHLHEPAILQVLRHRFFHGLVYTSTGSILVALNPFRRLDLYSDATKSKYYTLGGDKEAAKQLAPHVYGVADKAFRTMLSVMRDNKANQTILVSGESGAGKTETTKLIMNYLAYVSTCRRAAGTQKLSSSANGQPTIHDRVLESNPILEAFGNARTNRNNNSSRFGKFIKLGFTATGEMLGAQISTYLLERVRLVSQSKGERNYHIFYEMISGSSKEDRHTLGLLDVTEYKYLNGSECYIRLDGVDDGESYKETRHAMTSLGMDEDEQLHVMKVVSAVLHLGNVSFVSEKGKDSSTIEASSSGSLESICSLLGVERDVLHNTLCTKQIKAGAEFITMKLPVNQATSTRDSVVKTLYSNLFNWLVARINKSIEYKEERGSQFIGVVDIFGFEIFEENSLEQLCINYANEKLQQLFGRFVFRMEQETYVSEEIPWKFVDYPNNDICVTMLETRQMGLFSLLDEQCLIPKGNDEKLANKYYECLAKESSFSVSRLQRAKGQFVIHHYAGNVCYTTQGFCEKNKDHMHTEAIDLLKTSKFGFVRSIFESMGGASSPRNAGDRTSGGDTRRRSGIMSSTVVAQFKSQLSTLLEVLNATEPHFVRCIKPNDEVSSSIFEKKRVVEQLRCSGVLEAVKISRSGYPVRFVHDVFIRNYSCILGQQSKIPASRLKEVALELVTKFTAQFKLQLDSKHPPFQVGKTKVFCLPEAHNALEAARAKALYKSVITLQRYCLGYAARSAYQRMRQSAILLQTTWRRFTCRRRFLYIIERQRGAIKLQAAARGFLSRRLVKHVKAVTVIQSFVRGWLVRREYSANTLSFDHDVSYVGSIDRTTDDSLEGSFSLHSQKDHLNPLISIHSAPSERGGSDFSHEFSDPDGRYRGNSINHYRDSKKRLEAYEPPKQIKNEYEIVWECGLLGLYFESDPISGMPIVRRVHESLSNCADIFEVSRGDVLLAVGKVKVKKGDIRRILSLLQEVQKPVRLHFLRNPTESFRMRSGSIELLGEEDYEVLWKEGVPLGLGFRPDVASGYPCVMQANGNQGLPGMFNVRIGDFLIFINEFSTQGVRFQKVIDILESGPRPAVLRFRHNDMADDMDMRGSNPQEDDRFMRQSCISLNPKVDHSLYYITWKEEDGPLGIVVKQESTSYYPRVINVKNEGAVTRESQKNRVEVGDVLLSINNNNISKMGFGAAMRLLQKGPKPLLLMFQRPRESFSTSLTKSMNL
ncbi:Myosin-like protein [Globisporangium polare]